MATPRRGAHHVCIDCAKPRTAARRLSVRGLCEPCAIDRMRKSAVQIQAQEGPYYDEWRRGMADFARRVSAG